MAGWGMTFIILGIGSFVLPLVGLQFSVFTVVREVVFHGSQGLTSLVFIGVGAAMLFIGAFMDD